MLFESNVDMLRRGSLRLTIDASRMPQGIRCALLIALFQPYGVAGQGVDLRSEIRGLAGLGDSLFACDSPYWKVIAKGKDAIPALIHAVGDTTRTSTYHACKTTPLRAGDIAYLALGEIVAVPFFAITHHQLCVMDENDCMAGLFDYIEKHRSGFQYQLNSWYSKEGPTLKWYRFSSNDRKVLNRCYGLNEIHGMYR